MNFSNYAFRCSALGKIMSKSGKITDSNYTYLHELFIGEINGIRKEVSSKYFEKGKYMEEDGITLLNDTLYKGRLLVKNKERRNNTFVHGEADCIAPDGIVWDIKHAWDRFTFGKADLSWDYEWQLRGYMWLWGKQKAGLFYCLNNMPDHIMSQMERQLFYQNHYVSLESPEYLEAVEQLHAKHTYNHLPLYARFRFWEIDHSDEKIEQLQERVQKCREVLQEMWEDHEAELMRNMVRMGEDPDAIINGMSLASRYAAHIR